MTEESTMRQEMSTWVKSECSLKAGSFLLMFEQIRSTAFDLVKPGLPSVDIDFAIADLREMLSASESDININRKAVDAIAKVIDAADAVAKGRIAYDEFVQITESIFPIVASEEIIECQIGQEAVTRFPMQRSAHAYSVGDTVMVIRGPWEGSSGKIMALEPLGYYRVKLPDGISRQISGKMVKEA